MEHLNEDKARIFDNFYSNDSLTLLKIFSFFMEGKQRPKIAVLIKYMELNICMQKSVQRHETPTSFTCKNKEPALDEILCEISDYLPKESREMMDQVKNMKETFETYSQMMEMMNLMNEDASTDAQNGNTDQANIT